MCEIAKKAVGRVYLSSSRCIYENLAFEEFLFRKHDLEKDGDAMLIWSNKPAVVIGRHQNPWIEVNLPFLRKSGIDLARRHSGGGTVYHDMGNLNISFLTSHKSHCRPRNLQILAKAINNNFKVNVVPNKRDDMDLQPGDRKCSGTAARISRGKAYHHLTLLVEADLRKLSTSLKSPFVSHIKSNATPSVRASSVGFLKQDDKNADIQIVKQKIVENYISLFEKCPVEEVNVLSEMSENEEIAKNYYDLVCFDWVFGKTPKFSFEKDGASVVIEKGFVKETSTPKYPVDCMIFSFICSNKVHYYKSIANYSKTWNYSRNFYTSSSRFQSVNFYETLGVKKDATQREIKSAYFQLSKKYHPDVAGNSANAAAKFLEITEAYDCLRDPERRRAYDNQMSGRGGRYPGDYSDPFQFQQRQGFQYQSRNPFHNKQYSQEEFERIWNEFNRMRNQRETYDQRMEYEKQRLWMEYAKRRAERWQAFHQRYPDGPPGSFKWEFRWGPNAENQQKRVYQGWELIRRIALIYFLCFMIVSFFQVFYHAFSTDTPRRDPRPREEASDKDKIETMISRQPASPSSYMYSQPEVGRSRNPTNVYVPSDSLMSYHPSGKEITYSDETGSQFSSYVPSDK